MAANSWELTIKGHDELLVKMEKYSSESERVINEVLRRRGANIALEKMEPLIPVSPEILRQGHKHARFSKPFKVNHENLGFTIRPKPKFNYLKYPELGIGHSKNNQPEEFMKRGLSIALNPITEELLKGFDELNKK
ncbi:hypothetical protein P7D68_17650 [Enterococcus avium]|uniref:HK97-gp10 family putative phage morphogenesis protein n=1 Tax=Enterococcus avium TaxID=33945 RepID=UPI00288EAE20|nr:HK97-gp10 family putative phage morphogenesis protein [Enterococcus avium]MDT2472030.1 hypothetical protein [Enterococcus avium]